MGILARSLGSIGYDLWRGLRQDRLAQERSLLDGRDGDGGYYGLESRAAGSAIFVAPEGIDAAWPNTGGRDVNFAKQMVAALS